MIIVVVLLLAASARTMAAEPQGEAVPAPFLLGSAWGLRDRLAARGVHPEIVLTTEWWKNLHGGRQSGTEILHNLDLTLAIETRAAGLPFDGTFFLYVLSNFGGSASRLVGDFQFTSNIEAPSTIKLYEAWYEQRFLSDRLSLLVGLHDYNSEFYVAEYGLTLLNSSPGIGPEISQLPPSIFPTTAVGARLRWEPGGGTYLLFGAYDGVPGDPDEERGTRIQLRRQDGIFYGMEVGHVVGEPAGDYRKLALGAWYRDSDYVDVSGKRRTHNAGLYLLAEKSLYRSENSGRHVGGFLQLGITRQDRNEAEHYLGAGLIGRGLVPKRKNDEVSVGVAHVRSSGSFRRTAPGSRRAETAIELTYRAEIRPGLWIQPDLQYVVHPGFDPTLDDALVLAVRIVVSL
jgi:porin